MHVPPRHQQGFLRQIFSRVPVTGEVRAQAYQAGMIAPKLRLEYIYPICQQKQLNVSFKVSGHYAPERIGFYIYMVRKGRKSTHFFDARRKTTGAASKRNGDEQMGRHGMWLVLRSSTKCPYRLKCWAGTKLIFHSK